MVSPRDLPILPCLTRILVRTGTPRPLPNPGPPALEAPGSAGGYQSEAGFSLVSSIEQS